MREIVGAFQQVGAEGWCQPYRDGYYLDSADVSDAQCTEFLQLDGVQGVSFAPEYHTGKARCNVHGHAADEATLREFEKSFGMYGENLENPITSADLL